MSSPKQEAVGETPSAPWHVLPDDMGELILGRLPIAELGRVSATCRSFHAALRRRIGEQQQARCDLTAEWFGRKRIMCIADIINSFLKQETKCMTLATRDTHTCQISLNGAFQVKGLINDKYQGPYEAGMIFVEMCNATGLESQQFCHMFVEVPTPNQGYVYLSVDRPHKRVQIDVFANKGLVNGEGVALVQGLLTWGFGPRHDAWSHGDVRIFFGGGAIWLADHQVQIAPLLPLVAGHPS